MEVRLKRVYDPESPGDGFRVLVDKLWPRGIRKEAFHNRQHFLNQLLNEET